VGSAIATDAPKHSGIEAFVLAQRGQDRGHSTDAMRHF
jgi:hypothetical protein